ncbi:MAG: TauD/TfdA family dioxygenase [Actinomycetota bacterium]|nr:TauD/TfdA family dioxygenase [Acidimicrobiia bacterium]MDQ3293913.1 TauD/TfdA family dioxygenase [Actinomycetota bacterium]
MPVELTPLTGTIGSAVRGVRLADAVEGATVAALRATLVDRKVLVFPGQHLDPDELVRAGRLFGELTPAHPVLPPLDGAHPEVLEIDATRSRTDPRYRDEYEQDTWHTDVSFMADPPLGSLLAGVVIPPAGGDTAFVDLQAAYASLSAPVQVLVDGLRAEHDGRKEFDGFLRDNPEGGVWGGRRFTVLEPVVHPVVRVHPESGRRGLFVNPTFTTRIVGLSRLESAGLLDLLYRHATAAEHTFRHRWAEGDVVVWDNRSTMHLGVRDYGDHHRVLHRVTVRGDVPVGVVPAAAVHAAGWSPCRGPLPPPQVVAALAHLGGDDAEAHQHRERPAPEA